MLIGKGDRPDLIEVVGGLVALALTSDMTAGAAAAMATEGRKGAAASREKESLPKPLVRDAATGGRSIRLPLA